MPSDFTRKILFKNISVPAKGSTTVEYETVFKGDSASSDKIKIVFSNKFEDKDAAVNAALKSDNLPDISVTKEGNPTGQVRYYYTLGADTERDCTIWNCNVVAAGTGNRRIV